MFQVRPPILASAKSQRHGLYRGIAACHAEPDSDFEDDV